MNRKEFLSLVGIGATGVFVTSCLSACKKENNTNIDFTLDLSNSANSSLTSNGGYLISQGVIVAKTNAGEYIAVSAACTHQGVNVQFQASSNRFQCPSHGANFTSTGAVQNGPANSPLTKYNTSLSGNMLRVYS
jgi:cytochrome b6-f complex iron-sulfur subunit